VSRATADLAASLRLLVLDVDGVLTDGRLWFGAAGEALKAFHVRDGHGIKQLRAAGVEVAVISGRTSPAVDARMRELGVTRVVQGAEDKQAALEALLAALGITAAQAACLVDDLPDLPLLRSVGLPAAVADAHPAVLAEARHVTALPGGQGAVREFCDWLLSARRAAS
jgi:3-deoxy-D-manno-octulosonate 8-phosphate phosphatase (KDO 8-P phosphatase)